LAVVAAVACGVFAYSALMRAMRTGEVSAVTPFRYSRLLFGVALGVVVFGEALDAMMIAGSLLIVLSGLVIVWRGKAR
jgi:drug/metabolite transporter (DMT)-like permease